MLRLAKKLPLVRTIANQWTRYPRLWAGLFMNPPAGSAIRNHSQAQAVRPPKVFVFHYSFTVTGSSVKKPRPGSHIRTGLDPDTLARMFG